MAKQGILAKAKPGAATNTLLYKAPIDASASTVLNVTAQGGSNTSFDVALKNYDQKLTLGASTYKLHTGDVVTNYRYTLNTPLPSSAGLTPGATITTSDGEGTFKFESFYIPAFTEIDVFARTIIPVTVESTSGTFAVGETFSTGTSPNDTTALIYAVAAGSGNTIVHIGPITVNGSGATFAAGDSVASTGGASGTISSGGVGTANAEFTMKESGGTERMYLGVDLTILTDRTYRFDTSDATMSGRDFKLSTTVDGEYGPDLDFSQTSDNGTEYTTGKTTNGTAGNAGAYSQYDFTQDTNLSGNLYIYDGGTGTAANANYGGSDRYLTTSDSFTYSQLYIYDKEGTVTAGSSTFLFGGVTYTLSSETTGPYGYIRDYSGTAAYVIKGVGSADFTTSDTFLDVPKLASGTRTECTISAVAVAETAYETQELLRKDNAITANTTEEIKSLVIGPGERLIVENNDADCSFVLVGFEDASTGFTTRTYLISAANQGASGSGG